MFFRVRIWRLSNPSLNKEDTEVNRRASSHRISPGQKRDRAACHHLHAQLFFKLASHSGFVGLVFSAVAAGNVPNAWKMGSGAASESKGYGVVAVE